MPYAATWTQIVTDISNDVVARLAAAGMPPLTPMPNGNPGKILLGPDWVGQHNFPPTIVFIPKGFRVGARSVTSRGDNTEILALMSQRAIRTQFKQFEVHVWGCNYDSDGAPVPTFTPNPDPDLDWDAVDAMYNILWQSVHALAAGIWETKSGTIDRGASKYQRVGRYAIFDLEIATPVLDTAQGFAPSDTSGKLTTKLQPAQGGTPSTGCSN
jgi:hypothetical protein